MANNAENPPPFLHLDSAHSFPSSVLHPRIRTTATVQSFRQAMTSSVPRRCFRFSPASPPHSPPPPPPPPFGQRIHMSFCPVPPLRPRFPLESPCPLRMDGNSPSVLLRPVDGPQTKKIKTKRRLRGRNGRSDGRTDGQKFPPLFYRTSSPSGPLPKSGNAPT